MAVQHYTMRLTLIEGRWICKIVRIAAGFHPVDSIRIDRRFDSRIEVHTITYSDDISDISAFNKLRTEILKYKKEMLEKFNQEIDKLEKMDGKRLDSKSSRPIHICGDPNSPCDTTCMENYYRNIDK